MTNEQAINRLKHLTFEPTIDEWDEEALNMAIEALSAQPVITCDGCRFVGTYDTDFPCCNCIRREKDYYESER